MAGLGVGGGRAVIRSVALSASSGPLTFPVPESAVATVPGEGKALEPTAPTRPGGGNSGELVPEEGKRIFFTLNMSWRPTDQHTRTVGNKPLEENERERERERERYSECASFLLRVFGDFEVLQ